MLLRFPLLFFLTLQHLTAASSDFSQCLSLVRNNTFGPHAGMDNHGGFPTNVSDATAIPYEVCIERCGTGPTAFDWSPFAQEFSAWLLPYLALLSQLPFGAHDRWDNLIAVLLTVGSPAIAAYSIVLTVLNGRWLTRLFSRYTYPNSRHAVHILNGLQQSPLCINPDGCLLASLVVLPENDGWWSELVTWLDYTHTWSISAASSLAWVVVAYVFTIIDSFTDDVEETVEVNGQGVGSIWLWLIPIVISWLQISPKCDSERVRKALDRANEFAYVATYDHNNIAPTRIMSNQRAIYLDCDKLQTLHSDQYISVPVYNYARLFTWTEAVQTVAAAFSEATRHADSFEPVNPDVEWVEGNRSLKVRPENRLGSSFQVQTYCVPVVASTPDPYGFGVWNKIILAFLAGLGLQWGTAGAAILTVYFTPTTGLGCRSGAYLIYAAASTVVMTMLVMSSILAHYASRAPPHPLRPHMQPFKRKMLAWSSILLRRLGKTLAFFNAVWLMMACIFQFTAFFSRCYCNSSVIGRGAKFAYDVIVFLHADVTSMKVAWIGGVVLAIGTATLFIIFINLMIVTPRLH
ncbi:hypothetical protein PQX77_005920 [Marasmius sp. AFHP31]|nr:hypothetical protein PQX77_005920 [Marasmius sp. AFHP31]